MITNIIEVVIGTIIGIALYHLFRFLVINYKIIMNNVKWRNNREKAFIKEVTEDIINERNINK